MATIFISYRRSDSAPYAGRLRDLLVRLFGGDAVFMDIDDIAPGTDFPDLIAQTLTNADAILVVIGPAWLSTAGPDGKRRLDDAKDYVRREIATGIEQRKRVVPLLVGGARMPSEEELPAQISELARLNALAISDQRFDQDMERLLAVLAPGSSGAADGDAHRLRAAGVSRRVALGVAVLAAGAVAGLAWWGLRPQHAVADGSDRAIGATAAASIDGAWEASVTYGWGAVHKESFRFKSQGGEVFGSAGFLGVQRTLFDGRIAGNELAFSTRTQEMLGSGPTRTLTHRYRGTVSGDTIHFLMATEGGSASGGPIEFSARRVPAKQP